MNDLQRMKDACSAMIIAETLFVDHITKTQMLQLAADIRKWKPKTKKSKRLQKTPSVIA